MIANVSFREFVIFSSDVFVKCSLAFIAFSMFYFFNAVKRNLRIHGRFYLNSRPLVILSNHFFIYFTLS